MGVFWVASLSWLLGFPLDASAQQEADCQRFFREKSFDKAGACYEGVRKSVLAKKRDEFRDLLEDRYLRNGAVSYAQAAKATNEAGKQSRLRMQAASLLFLSVRSGTCQASNRCDQHRILAERLQEQAQATPLGILTGSEEARITVRGEAYEKRSLGSFNERVLPGRYKVEIVYSPNQTQQREVEIKPGVAFTLNATPTQIKLLEKRIVVADRTPPLVLAGYIAGGVIVAAGIGMLVYAPLEQGRLNAVMEDFKTARTLTDEEYNNGFDQAQTIKVIGAVALGVGVLVVGAALIGQFLAVGSKKETIQPLPGLSLQPPLAPPFPHAKAVLLFAPDIAP